MLDRSIGSGGPAEAAPPRCNTAAPIRLADHELLEAVSLAVLREVQGGLADIRAFSPWDVQGWFIYTPIVVGLVANDFNFS
jgi:hypothetical protein